ncbi:hypothetical protein D3273_00510 [Lichenibacterium minor]|uniref:Uncharacterized protein n=1 Tax=Lichenibacterium minor TaxID=2316528 RepID=A0A4Q2UB03_9HYPH|nr:hypothetical protein [Lichenibacterium minor]RYC33772.1 hypothetical protein D3273_00510 [Lichenibacterium minor]
MRALLERSRSARTAVAVLALGAVFGLARAATAGDDLGLRRDTLWPEPQPAIRLVDVPAASPVRHRHARRIWAASPSRPLRIAVGRHRHRIAVADVPRARARGTVARHPVLVERQAVFPRLIVLPKPARPALVTIYQDRTLRDGDAVMMADGIHVFRGMGAWPHRPHDFVRLTFAAALDWHLRHTLDVLDRNPPTRWSSMGAAAG